MLLPVGIALFALGLIGLIYGIFQRLKAGRITDAPLVSTGDVASRGRAVAGAKGQVSAQGIVSCAQPVIAPFSGVPCLYYEIKCTARWKDGDTQKSKLIDEQKVAAQFVIDDGSGAVPIDAREGGDFEPTQKKSETKGTGLVGGITGTDLEFGNYRVNTPILDVGTKYEVEEEVLPMVPRLYACGRIGDLGNVIAAPSWRALILSAKSRDELLASATKTAKLSLIAGAALLLVGGGTATAGTLLESASKEPSSAASVAASTPAPTPAPAPAPSTTQSTAAAPASAPTSSVAVAVSAAPAKGKGKGGKGKKSKKPTVSSP
ncbi:MAG: GIDE domain-containing protein [Labilithrix sp.]